MQLACYSLGESIKITSAKFFRLVIGGDIKNIEVSVLVEWSQILISDKQVEEIARTVLNGLRDIDAFIQEHQTEYERFCATEYEAIAKENKNA